MNPALAIDAASRVKAALNLRGVLWTEDLVADLVGVLDAVKCEWCQVNERNARRNMAAAWDGGMLAHTQGLGSANNPYRTDE